MSVNPQKLDRVEGSHWVSPVNFDAEVVGQFDFPTPLGLIDSTLRKVRYTAGATTTVDGFLRIAAALDEVGIRDESLNLDWWGDDEPNRGELELVRETLAGGFGFTTNVYADTLLGNGTGEPAGKRTVDLLLGLGAAVIAPGIVPAPDAAAQARQFEQLADVVSYARSCGLRVTITLAQCGRRDFEQMVRAANEALALGVERLDLMDSTSSLSPEAMRVFVRRFRSRLDRPVPLTMHVHDDFGLGTAAAIAAASAGAGPDVSVNGASYRCGFPPLEEVVTSLEVLYGVDTGIAVEKLQWICELVAAEMGVPLPPLKPVSGGYAFLKHTPGDVLTVLRDGADTFPPVSGCVHASVTGAQVEWRWDGLSTPAMAAQLAANLGLDLDEDGVLDLRDRLDAAVAAVPDYPRWLEPAEVERIARGRSGLAALNEMSEHEARAVLSPCVPEAGVVETLVRARPFASADALLDVARTGVARLDGAALGAALDRFSPIGSEPAGDGTSARWSRTEEAGIEARDDLAALAHHYAQRFGFTYVVAAAGRSTRDVLDDLRTRLLGDPADEPAIARREMSLIVAGRLRRALHELELGGRP